MKGEESRAFLISVAMKLFSERGVDGTSISAICKAANVSKGMLYHHFESKEALFDAVIERQKAQLSSHMREWSYHNAASAKQALIELLESNIDEEQAHELDAVFSQQSKSPEFIVTLMKSNILEGAPIVAQLFEAGNRDGSLAVEKPRELAEVFLLLLNIWADPNILPSYEGQMLEKLEFIQSFMKNHGADVITQGFIEKTMRLLECLKN